MVLQAPTAQHSRLTHSHSTTSLHSDPPSSSRASTPSVCNRSSTPSLYRQSATPSLYRGSSVSSSYRRSSTPSLLGRASTPILFPNGGRIRSHSVKPKTDEERRQEEIAKRKIDSQQKLKSAWELIKEKYGSIRIEDDDEIDLRTGKITRDRGKLREYEGREFGEVSDDENEDERSSLFGGTPGETEYEYGSDEDELGQWDERSGLGSQYSDTPLFEEEAELLKRNESWDTPEAQSDLQEFLKLEAEQQRLFGRDTDVEDNEVDSERHDDMPLSEDSDSYDEDESLLSPRSRGNYVNPPRLEDLFLSDDEQAGEVEESSEDELLLGSDGVVEELSTFDGGSFDRETVTVVEPLTDDTIEPVSQPRPRQILEVVIPVRPRRASLPGSITTRRPRVAPARISTSVSAPSLANLFDSPPPDDDLCSRTSSPVSARQISPEPLPSPSPSSHSIHQISSSRSGRNVPQSPSPSSQTTADFVTLTSSSNGGGRTSSLYRASIKGKSRMIGERPSEDAVAQSMTVSPGDASDVSPYYTRLWKSRSGAIKLCKRCKKAGGERADKAALCRGRKGPSRCLFESSGRDKQAELRSDHEPGLVERATSGSSRPDRRRTVGRSGSRAHSLTTDKSDTDNSPSVGRKPNRRSKLVAAISDSETEQRGRSATTPFRATSEYPEEPSGRPDDLDPDIYCQSMIYRKSGRARYCGQCWDAGGDRKDKAWWCKGRAWIKFCYFSTDEDGGNSGLPRKQSTIPNPHSKRTTPGRTPEVQLPLHSKGDRIKRKRVISSEMPSNGLHLVRATPTYNTTHMPSPPPTSSVEPCSPMLYGGEQAERTRSLSAFSMPPSSPPIFTPSTRPVHPTPSPSLSATAAAESPTTQKFSTVPTRGATIGYRPTPPSSVDGARSSSLMSENMPLSLPRRGILRRPSDASCPPSSGSIKRARFSLQPRSPVRYESSDPLQDTDQSDEDGASLSGNSLHSQVGSSPYFGSSSPGIRADRYSCSASPLRNEWSVRARDIGIQLGPEHTGSLPRGMIKALAPSLAKPTLASSASINRFSLPTPTPSTGSSAPPPFRPTVRNRSSPALRRGGSVIGGDSSNTTGLMLPPPVPIKQFTLAPSPAPAPAPVPALALDAVSDSTFASVSASVRRLETPITPSIGRTEPKSSTSAASNLQSQLKPLNRTIKGRSRSRSISITPSSSSSSAASSARLTTPSYRPLLRMVATTPRKKSRIERELARRAEEMDDAGLEWGMDEDTEDGGRMWREASVVMLHSEL
ncbi:uncharacterized protein I303_106511 [Kwoniella dejecticola CBS 10117]|uniref:Uncharacterized protein n=1 Tax=Kwoniella dejecticola CBS 10117 TaxID=1296121 RepID=A0AAJ8MIY2_9TREE